MDCRNLDRIADSLKVVEVKSSVTDLIVNLHKRIYDVAFSSTLPVRERTLLVGKAFVALFYLANKLVVNPQSITLVAENTDLSIGKVESLGIPYQEHSFTLYTITQMGGLVMSAGELENEMSKTERSSNRLEAFKWQVTSYVNSLIVSFVVYAMKNGLDIEEGLTQATLRMEEL